MTHRWGEGTRELGLGRWNGILGLTNAFVLKFFHAQRGWIKKMAKLTLSHTRLETAKLGDSED